VPDEQEKRLADERIRTPRKGAADPSRRIRLKWLEMAVLALELEPDRA
jgi:hypothetical protein